MKVLLNAGGMDSFMLAHTPELLGQCLHVFVDVGMAYNPLEVVAARRLAQAVGAQLQEVTGRNLAQFEDESAIIPFRNAELILAAASYGEDVYMGVIADEINSDKSPEFMRAMEEVMNISYRPQYWTEGKTFRIHTPFRDRTKQDLIREFVANYSLELLLESISCYSVPSHCGQCGSCFKRWVALNCALERDCGGYFRHHPGRWKPKAYWTSRTDYSAQRMAGTIEAFSYLDA